jgi:hypothetical protein
MLGVVCISLVWGWMVGWMWRLPRGWRGGAWAAALTAVVWTGVVAVETAMRWEELRVVWWIPIAVSAAGWTLASGVLELVRGRRQAACLNNGGFHA